MSLQHLIYYLFGSFFTGYKDYNIDTGISKLLCHTGDPIKTSADLTADVEMLQLKEAQKMCCG